VELPSLVVCIFAKRSAMPVLVEMASVPCKSGVVHVARMYVYPGSIRISLFICT